MLNSPCYSQVGEGRVDRKIENLELKTPKETPWEKRLHWCSTSYVFIANCKELQKKTLKKKNWEKNIHFYRVVYYNTYYFYTYILKRVRSAHKMISSTHNDWYQCDKMNSIIILTRKCEDTIYTICPKTYLKYPSTTIRRTPSCKIGVQILPKLTRNQNSRYLARKNGSQYFLP